MNYSYDANGRMTYAYHSDIGGGTDAQSSIYDCAGQRVQTSANGVTRNMVYDVFGQQVADYLVNTNALERENIYRGGQLLAVYETGASCYKSISQFVNDFYLGALGRAYNSSIDPTWKTTLAQAQAQGQGQLIAAAQSMGNSVFTSPEFNNHLPDTVENRGPFVTALYAAYLGRVPDGYGYQAWLNALNSGSSRTDVRNGFAYSAEFQNDVGQLCVSTSGSSPSYKYVLSDLQGTTRAVLNNNGASSTIISRHDYLPFGEEIWSGTGLRTSSQSYGTPDRNRQKYGLTERDDATGLDHTWWRKYESFAGRWTSPDPYAGSMDIANPQSFNRYNYTQNDPVNFVDPSGLDERWCFGYWVLINGENTGIFLRVNCWVTKDSNPNGSGGGGGGGVNQKPKNSPTPLKPTPLTPDQKKAIHEQVKQNCLQRKAKERQERLDQVKSRVGRAMAKGCAVSGVIGAGAGLVGGGIVGLVTGPGEPLVGAAGATVGGILGCAAGALGGGFGQLIIGEHFERKDADRKASTAEKECNDEADKAVAGR